MITDNNREFISKYGSSTTVNNLVTDPDEWNRQNVAENIHLTNDQISKLSKRQR